MRTVCNSYIVTVYIQIQTTWQNKIKEKEKRIIKTTWRKSNPFWLSNTISKRENTTVEFQEECKVSYCILPRILIIVKPPTFIKDIMSSFNGIVTTWILKLFIRKESKLIFSCEIMINSGSWGFSTKWIWMTEIFQLWFSFEVQRFERLQIII